MGRLDSLRFATSHAGQKFATRTNRGPQSMAEFLPLPEAVSRNLQDGDTVAFEGFTHLIPTAAAHEAIRQGFRDLTLIRMTPDLIYDQMVGMGMARKVVFSYLGNPGVGLLRRLRDAIENGFPAPIEIE